MYIKSESRDVKKKTTNRIKKKKEIRKEIESGTST
jgi:hypothetical protein